VGLKGDAFRNRPRAFRGGRLGKTLDPTWAITPEYVGIKKREETYTYVQCAKGGCFAQELIMSRQTPPPVIDRETVEWKIKTLRNAIGHDWAVLATEGLNSEEEGDARTP